MKLLSTTAYRIIPFFFIFVANSIALKAQHLPASWQPGMTLRTYFGGGMRQQTDSVLIAELNSFERHTGVDNNKKYAFHFSQQELNDLLQFLKAHNFDKITTQRSGMVYDGWRSDITVRWNDEVIMIDTGTGFDVPEKYKKDLSAISGYINNIVEQKKKQKR